MAARVVHALLSVAGVRHLLVGVGLCAVLVPGVARSQEGPAARFEAVARERVASSPFAAALRAPYALELQAVHPDPVGATIRFTQRVRGLPVLGGSVVIRERARGGAEILGARLLLDSTPATAALPAAQAALRCEKALGVAADQVKAITLAYQVSGRLVWSCGAPSLPGSPAVLLDASGGEVVERAFLSREVLGRIYEDDPVNSPQTSDRPLPGLAAGAQSLRSADGRLAVVQHQGGSLLGEIYWTEGPGPSNGMDFLYNPPADPGDATDPFAAVNAYYHGSRAQGFFEQKLGVSMAEESWRVAMVVNGRNGEAPMNGAFFTPLGLAGGDPRGAIVLGQGEVDFAIDSDVLLHEYTHMVSMRSIGYSGGQFAVDTYGFAPMGGAIDEGMADYVAATMNGRAQVGAGLPAKWRRDLSEGGKRCPEDTLGEVHEDGEIVGAAAWELRGLLGKGRADAVLWGGRATLGVGAQPRDFALAVLERAEEMRDEGLLSPLELAEAKGVLGRKGLLGCGREQSLDERPHSSGMLGLSAAGKLLGRSCEGMRELLSLQSSFRYTFRPGSGATAARFRVRVEPLSEGELRWRLLVRRGEPVVFGADGKGLPVPGAVDAVLGESSEEGGELEVEVPPGEEAPVFHAVLVHQNCGQARLRLEATSVGGGGIGGAGGAGGEGPGGGSGRLSGERSAALQGVAFEEGRVRCGAGEVRGARLGGAWFGALLGLALARSSVRRRPGCSR